MRQWRLPLRASSSVQETYRGSEKPIVRAFRQQQSASTELHPERQPFRRATGSLGVRHETVRSQLNSLFAKTDTNRQAELTAVLNKLRRWSGP